MEKQNENNIPSVAFVSYNLVEPNSIVRLPPKTHFVYNMIKDGVLSYESIMELEQRWISTEKSESKNMTERHLLYRCDSTGDIRNFYCVNNFFFGAVKSLKADVIYLNGLPGDITKSLRKYDFVIATPISDGDRVPIPFIENQIQIMMPTEPKHDGMLRAKKADDRKYLKCPTLLNMFGDQGHHSDSTINGFYMSFDGNSLTQAYDALPLNSPREKMVVYLSYSHDHHIVKEYLEKMGYIVHTESPSKSYDDPQALDARFYRRVGKAKYVISGKNTRPSTGQHVPIASLMSGIPVFSDPIKLYQRMLMPEFTTYITADELLQKIRYLEENPSEYQKLRDLIIKQSYVADFKYALSAKQLLKRIYELGRINDFCGNITKWI